MSFSLFGIARHQGELVALFNPANAEEQSGPIVRNAAQIQRDITMIDDPNTCSRLEALLFLMQYTDPSIYNGLPEALADYKMRHRALERA